MRLRRARYGRNRRWIRRSDGTLSHDALTSWGWRIAFGVAGLLGLVGLWLRTSVEETDAFTELTERDGHATPRRAVRCARC